MAIVEEKAVSGSGGGAPPADIEDGTYTAVCYSVADSTWPEGDFGFGHKPERDAVILSMLIEDVLDEEGENIILDCKVTLSLHENATLRRYAKALLGKDVTKLDTEELRGGRVFVTVEHPNDNDWPRITNMTAMPKGKAQ
jgi:hypothetical protein